MSGSITRNKFSGEVNDPYNRVKNGDCAHNPSTRRSVCGLFKRSTKAPANHGTVDFVSLIHLRLLEDLDSNELEHHQHLVKASSANRLSVLLFS